MVSHHPKKSLPKWVRALSEYETLHREGGFAVENAYYYTISTLIRTDALDVACGEGWLEAVSPNIVGADFSVEALRNARRNGARTLVRAAAEYLPFKDDSFSVAVSLGSLEHFLSPKDALREMRRLSKVVFLTAHAEIPFPLSLMRRTIGRILIGRGQPIEHRFGKGELEKLLKEAGLFPVLRGFYDYVGLFYLWERSHFLSWIAKHLKLPLKIPIPSHLLYICSRARPGSFSERFLTSRPGDI